MEEVTKGIREIIKKKKTARTRMKASFIAIEIL